MKTSITKFADAEITDPAQVTGGAADHLAHAQRMDDKFDNKAGKGEGSKQEEHWDAKKEGYGG
jgi:hypothetical protein